MAGILLVVGIAGMAIAAIATILWGMRIRARQREADSEVTERNETAHLGPVPVRTADGDAPIAIAPEASASTPAPVPTPPAGTSAQADDLTQLKGLGPKVAGRFTELGVTRFEQLASLSPEDEAKLDAQLGSFSGRMARDRWVEQAKFLAKDDRAGFEAAFGKL